ncbi:MAG: aminotransferase class IV, partial [Planktothrix sp.]
MFFYNGNLQDSTTLELSITDPALLYGATVFTTLRVYEQSLDSPLTAWQQHCQRLKSSLEPFQ